MIRIMIRTFINRTDELRFLRDKATSASPELVVIYGRRRVGKTELIKQLGSHASLIYFLADKTGTTTNVARFSREASAYFSDVPPAAATFAEAFAYLVRRSSGRRLVIAIDEFSYLVEKDPTTPSVFQRIIDEILKDSRIMLVLCGSSMEMMERGVLSSKSPLYGRRTGDWKVQPLNFRHAIRFFTRYNFERKLTAAMILGGIPEYLIRFDDQKTPRQNIIEHILRRGEPLFSEAEIVLKEELREPAVYLRILQAMCRGPRKLADIATATGIPANDLPKYLTVLKRLTYVERIHPVGHKPRTKQSLYKLTDAYMAFYTAFVLPFRSDLEIGRTDRALSAIDSQLPAFLGRQFEQVCAEVLWTAPLPFAPHTIGPWWGHARDTRPRTPIDIDIIATDGDNALFVECKWQSVPERRARAILSALKEKAAHTPILSQHRHYGIIARKIHGKEALRKDGFLALDLDDIERVFTGNSP